MVYAESDDSDVTIIRERGTYSLKRTFESEGMPSEWLGIGRPKHLELARMSDCPKRASIRFAGHIALSTIWTKQSVLRNSEIREFWHISSNLLQQNIK